LSPASVVPRSFVLAEIVWGPTASTDTPCMRKQDTYWLSTRASPVLPGAHRTSLTLPPGQRHAVPDHARRLRPPSTLLAACSGIFSHRSMPPMGCVSASSRRTPACTFRLTHLFGRARAAAAHCAPVLHASGSASASSMGASLHHPLASAAAPAPHQLHRPVPLTQVVA
jgi:hypothetical protein